MIRRSALKRWVEVARRATPLLLATLAHAGGLAAQRPVFGPVAPDSLAGPPGRWGTLLMSGGVVEDRWRLAQLLGRSSTEGFLVRSASTPLTWRASPRLASWQVIAPHLRAVQNSSLPFGFNEDGLWAGRGQNLALTAGGAVRFRGVTAVIAPRWEYSENAPFQTFPYPSTEEPPRQPFASPWSVPPQSLDQPLRFGDQSRTRIGPGESSLSLAFGRFATGASTESLWWGPGIRNALVMSSNAPGIPHLFLRTSAPIATRFGRLEGRWLLGRLRESDYFDADSSNDVRSLSALALTFAPAFDPNLTVGLTRAVYARADDGAISPGAAFDVLRSVGRPNAAPGDTLLPDAPGRDQLFSLFARWVFPRAGFESYVEWARFQEPASLRDVLADPGQSQGYTLGLQWARPVTGTSAVRLQAEATQLELSASYHYRPQIGSYTSRVVPQGYTHRGQVVGAAIGPGSSGQWLAADYVADGWQAGLVGGRIRWNNTAFYSLVARTPYAHDVSLFSGLRGSFLRGPVAVTAEYVVAQRTNYLFQTFLTLDSIRSVNIQNHSLRLLVSLSPR